MLVPHEHPSPSRDGAQNDAKKAVMLVLFLSPATLELRDWLPLVIFDAHIEAMLSMWIRRRDARTLPSSWKRKRYKMV